MRFDELEVGQAAAFARTVTEADVVLFAGVTGDFNPVHIDAVAAERSRFGGRIAHGMLSASLISTVLAMKLPGPGHLPVAVAALHRTRAHRRDHAARA